MPDTPPDLTAAERHVIERTGADPARYAAIRDVPRQVGGGRSVPDLLAALDRLAQEDDR